MTPEQELALLEAAAAGLDADLRDAFRDLVEMIEAGAVPRDAVQVVMASFTGDMAQVMATAMSGIMGTAVGTESILAMEVGGISLSRAMYAEAATTGDVVQGVVQRHVEGFTDSRRLARELYEGYNFRPPDAEPLRIEYSNQRLPKYMREALLTDDSVESAMKRAYARLQVDGLKTAPLRAAYQGVLDAVDAIQKTGAGQALLEKRLEVAFYERGRYFAQRIAQTELHRAYAEREARLLMDDDDVQFVQVRRAPGGGACICSLFAGRDLYGLGPGVYPKAVAPRPPFHPFCRCVNSPRLDLAGAIAQERDPDGDAYFLNHLEPSMAARVMGSQGKRDAVLRGLSPETVVNSGRDPLYHVKTVGSP